MGGCRPYVLQYFFQKYYIMSENIVVTENLCELFLQKIEGIEICAETMMILLKYAMEAVELSQIKGVRQKEMALLLLTFAINDSGLDDKETYLNMLEVMATAVDVIVDATKGKLAVNRTQGFLKKVFSCYKKMK